MVNPTREVTKIVIEGSYEPDLEGECGIDVSEYFEDGDSRQTVSYFQLKHSTKNANSPFTLSLLEKTLSHFAQRFTALCGKTDVACCKQFVFVSNRPVADDIKVAIATIANGGGAEPRFTARIEKITNLSETNLREFCQLLIFSDEEGNYLVQRIELRSEISGIIAGHEADQITASILELVIEKALPNSTGVILREDVLKRFGVDSERDLFPAPPRFEPPQRSVERKQYRELFDEIVKTSTPVIVHATGGVGKSVVAQKITEMLPRGSVGVVYDCFGGGTYRNESSPRHRACDGLVQIANELAALGLCRALIASSPTPTEAIFRRFIERVTEACDSLQSEASNAILIIIIDAADNAVMAAREFGQRSFVGPLLRENLDNRCRLVELCRTERVSLLEPPGKVKHIALIPFNEVETGLHLRGKFPTASNDDVREFFRLSGGNPRVQANALNLGDKSLVEMLRDFGPARSTVDEQIGDQLAAAVQRIRDQNTAIANHQIEAICRGLAVLPPFVPLPVLAAVANVEVNIIKSFVADLGRPLWCSDDSVQFRDEPTESWFRKTFSSQEKSIAEFASLIAPLGEKFTYAAKALPRLLLRAKKHDELIALALSDEHLPQDNPIDERDVRVYRLQFAFKAAVACGRLSDSLVLAFRAGEEMAGNQRQIKLLTDHIELIPLIQDSQKVQEYAYKRMLRENWEGSENACSAALLSSVTDFKGEARSYLRAAESWLRIFFDEQKKEKKRTPFLRHGLQAGDLVALAWSHFNLFGPSGLVEFASRWNSPTFVFNLILLMARSLVDMGRFDEIEEIARFGKRNAHITVAISRALISVAKYPPKSSLARTLIDLTSQKRCVEKPKGSEYNDQVVPAVVSFAEACAHFGFSSQKIVALLDFYSPPASIVFVAHDHDHRSRRTALRASTLRAVLTGNLNPTPEKMVPELARDKADETSYHQDEERRKAVSIVGTFLPFYLLRAKLIAGVQCERIAADKVRGSASYHSEHEYGFDPTPWEIPRTYFETLAFASDVGDEELQCFINVFVKRRDAKFPLRDQIRILRVCHRNKTLGKLRQALEPICTENIRTSTDESPEELAHWWSYMARAVLPTSRADAAAYFESAASSISKFGDEIVQRWEAIVRCARKASEEKYMAPEIVHRFIRCAEMVGDTVAREKYWNRRDVFRVAVRMSPAVAFASLSRWRDREVGRFEELIEALAIGSVRSRAISAHAGWCLSGFRNCNGSIELLSACVETSKEQEFRQRIFDAAVRDVALNSQLVESFEELRLLAEVHGLDSNSLDEAARNLPPRPKYRAPGIPETLLADNPVEPQFADLLDGINLFSEQCLNALVQRFEEHDYPHNWTSLFRAAMARVPEGRETEFLLIAIGAEKMGFLNVRSILEAIPQAWQAKASFRKVRPKLLYELGRRFAHRIDGHYSLIYYKEVLALNEADLESLRRGICAGIADSSELISDEQFFGYITSNAGRITPDESLNVLRFGLERFERHIPDEHGDGLWKPEVTPQQDAVKAYAGFIWSALGSPEFATRWEAAHCVRRLVELKCDGEISAIFEWMKAGKVGAFGCLKYPFYSLHAQQFFMIALARAAQDDATVLVPHAAEFQRLTLGGASHVLIQKFATEAALSIESQFPETYAAHIGKKLRETGVSPFPPVTKKTESTWKDDWGAGEPNGVYFSYDFDRYWFPPLAQIFYEATSDTMKRAAKFALRIAGTPEDCRSVNDGRRELWKKRDYSRRGTSHSHGSYPIVDDYRFYYSYHALMMTAFELYRSKPVVAYRDYSDWREIEPWADWMERHLLARADGRWLADRIDPCPNLRRTWTAKNITEDWLWEIREEDFHDVIANQNTLPSSLSIFGSWTDRNSQGWEEKVCVTSAFVLPDMADSLARTLRNSERAWEAALPSEHSDKQPRMKRFNLLAWIASHSGGDKRIDAFDPYSKNIDFPPYLFADSFAKEFNLIADSDKRFWSRAAESSPVAMSEVWQNRVTSDDDHSAWRCGDRIMVRTDFLRDVCTKLDRTLLISIQIARQGGLRSPKYDLERYNDPYFKVLTLSSDGTIRDIFKNYQAW